MDRRRLFVPLVTLAAGLAGLVATGLLVLAVRCQGSLTRMIWVGRPLLRVEAPESGAVLPRGGLAVVIGLADAGVVPETLRCRLNGEDVTSRLRVSSARRASGALFPVRAGSNRLEIGVFGRSWLGIWVEDVVVVEFRARNATPLDQA